LQYPIKIIQKSGQDFILDHIRKKYVLLTPEEKVRQRILKVIIEQNQYPKACIAVEKRIKINTRLLRFDVVVYHHISPWMLIECKEPTVDLTADTLLQGLNYNQTLQAQYITLTNGNQTMCLDVANNTWLLQLPTYPI
jgi:Type I restriction enzyme R protein N terminus (HSDR_N)